MPAAAEGALLLISPVRDEAAHVERMARAVARQRRPPDLWLVVDDGSQDDTPQRLAALAREIPWMRVLRAPARPRAEGEDGLAIAAEARAFNWALATVDLERFAFVGKLDGDVELAEDHFEQLLRRFARIPSLGIAGCRLVEPAGRHWRPLRIPEHHVHGAVKLYSRACLERIGGVQERLGWDTIDETYARMAGFITRTFPGVVARHHRPSASASGRLRGRARHGECAYVVRYGAGWTLLRSLKVAASPPVGLSGAAFVWGYARAAATGAPRVEDEQFKRFVRRELRARLVGAKP